MTSNKAKSHWKAFVDQCIKDGDTYYLFHHSAKHKKNLVQAVISDTEAIGILVELITNHPEAFNYIIAEINKKKVIAKA